MWKMCLRSLEDVSTKVEKNIRDSQEIVLWSDKISSFYILQCFKEQSTGSIKFLRRVTVFLRIILNVSQDYAVCTQP